MRSVLHYYLYIYIYKRINELDVFLSASIIAVIIIMKIIPLFSLVVYL